MALDFESTSSQSVDLGTSLPALNGKAGVTVMAWIFIESLPSTISITEQSIAGTPPVATSRIFFNVSAAGALIIGVRDADGGASQTLTLGTLSTGVWQHVCAIVDVANDTNELCVDGVSIGTGTPPFPNTSFPATDSANGAIGSSDDEVNQHFDGVIEDYRMYDRALSLVEVETIVACRGTDGIKNGLVQRYLLQEDAPGATASGVGTVRDIAETGRQVDPTNSPVYADGVNRFRRKLAG